VTVVGGAGSDRKDKKTDPVVFVVCEKAAVATMDRKENKFSTGKRLISSFGSHHGRYAFLYQQFPVFTAAGKLSGVSETSALQQDFQPATNFNFEEVRANRVKRRIFIEVFVSVSTLNLISAGGSTLLLCLEQGREKIPRPPRASLAQLQARGGVRNKIGVWENAGAKKPGVPSFLALHNWRSRVLLALKGLRFSRSQASVRVTKGLDALSICSAGLLPVAEGLPQRRWPPAKQTSGTAATRAPLLAGGGSLKPVLKVPVLRPATPTPEDADPLLPSTGPAPAPAAAWAAVGLQPAAPAARPTPAGDRIAAAQQELPAVRALDVGQLAEAAVICVAPALLPDAAWGEPAQVAPERRGTESCAIVEEKESEAEQLDVANVDVGLSMSEDSVGHVFPSGATAACPKAAAEMASTEPAASADSAAPLARASSEALENVVGGLKSAAPACSMDTPAAEAAGAAGEGSGSEAVAGIDFAAPASPPCVKMVKTEAPSDLSAEGFTAESAAPPDSASRRARLGPRTGAGAETDGAAEALPLGHARRRASRRTQPQAQVVVLLRDGTPFDGSDEFALGLSTSTSPRAILRPLAVSHQGKLGDGPSVNPGRALVGGMRCRVWGVRADLRWQVVIVDGPASPAASEASTVSPTSESPAQMLSPYSPAKPSPEKVRVAPSLFRRVSRPLFGLAEGAWFSPWAHCSIYVLGLSNLGSSLVQRLANEAGRATHAVCPSQIYMQWVQGADGAALALGSAVKSVRGHQVQLCASFDDFSDVLEQPATCLATGEVL
jgi:hypothetical protein